MKTLVIDRSRWLRGRVFGRNVDSRLLDSEGRQCCLGFFLSTCRVPKKHLENALLPSDLGVWPPNISFKSSLPSSAKWLLEEVHKPALLLRASRVEELFTEVNDDRRIGERERERKLKALFKERGVRVRFEGRTPRLTSIEAA